MLSPLKTQSPLECCIHNMGDASLEGVGHVTATDEEDKDEEEADEEDATALGVGGGEGGGKVAASTSGSIEDPSTSGH